MVNHVARLVKAYRASRGLSLDDLSAQTGVSRSMICQIEQEKTSPTLAILAKLAEGMQVRLGDLVDPGRGPTLYRRSKVQECRVTRSRDKSFECAPLTAESANRHLDVSRFAFDKPGRHRSTGHGPNAREYLFVETGKCTVEVGGETLALEAGDLLEFDASGPHEYVQEGPELARGISIIFYALG
jgi:transcriptional regulator with XRE-family HTH domain